MRRSRGLLGLSLLGLSNALVKPLWFLFLIAVCPRLLGPEGYGEMQTALSLAGLALGLTDLGLNNFTLREVAKDRTLGARFFDHVVPYRVVALLLGGVSVVWIGREVLPLSPDAPVLAGAAGYATALSLGGLMAAFYRAHGRLESEALATALERVATISAGAIVLWWTRSAAGVLAAMALASLLGVAVQGLWVRRRLVEAPPPSRTPVSGPFLRSALWLALPLGIADLFQSLYMRSGQLAVDGLMGAAAAGEFAQAARVVEMCSLLPALVAQGYLFSRLSSLLAVGEHAHANALLRRGALFLALAATLVAGALSWSAPALIAALSGAGSFTQAADVLRILVWAFPFTCLKDVCYVALLASHRHAAATAVYAAAAATTLALLVLLVPRHGLTAAAATAVAVEACAAAGLAWLYRSNFHRALPAHERQPSP